MGRDMATLNAFYPSFVHSSSEVGSLFHCLVLFAHLVVVVVVVVVCLCGFFCFLLCEFIFLLLLFFVFIPFLAFYLSIYFLYLCYLIYSMLFVYLFIHLFIYLSCFNHVSLLLFSLPYKYFLLLFCFGYYCPAVATAVSTTINTRILLLK